MKKALCIFTSALIIGSCLCLSSCNKKVEQTAIETGPTLTTVETIAATAETQTTASSEPEKSSKISTIDDYINNEEVQSQLKKSMSAFADTMSLDVFTENGDTIVYQYTYKEQYDKSTLDAMKEAIDSSLDKQTDLYTGMIEDVESATGVENVKIKLAYYLPDGTQVTEKTYEK